MTRKAKMAIPPRECQCGCGEYENECIHTRGKTYTIVGTRLDEFERDCASCGCSPAEVINILINSWLSNGRR